MRRATSSVLAGLVALTTLAGCSLVDSVRDSVSPRSSTSVAAEEPPAGMEGTERFYAQDLTWSKCSGGECTKLTVPVDYAKPDGETLEIAVLRVPASGKAKGSLLVNPGGPGGSGVSYARAAGFGGVVSEPVRRAYDIVGFDPRGVGRSSPIQCLDRDGMDRWLAQDPTPDDAAEMQVAGKNAADFADACRATDNPLLVHVSTKEAAKDMDILRSRVGDPKLTYLGKSYGTYLGAVYAGLFPAHVGRVVLDGALDPSLSAEQVNLGQAKGFERATQAWAEHCAGQSSCPFGTDPAKVVAGLADFLRQVDRTPLAKSGDPTVPAVTEGWASYGVAAAMYDQGMWDMLSDALSKAKAGDGSGLMELAYRYADRNPGGGYTSNLLQALYAVNCLDKPESAALADRAAQADRAAAEAPLWGPFLAWGSLACGDWPQPGDQKPPAPEPITAKGSGPIVVIGTTRDPATPYEWAVSLAEQLDKGTLVSFDGDGHTAYLRSNDCVDRAVDDWFLDGVVPKDGLRC